MYPLFESIKVQNRQIINSDYHDQRIKHSFKTLFGLKCNWKINNIIRLPDELDNETYKCRFEYNETSFKFSFEKYKYRKINSLLLKNDDQIEYDLKYTDRSCFERLKTGCQPDQDILIVKNGLITDTSFSNVCLWDEANWITPKRPLLKGIMRQKLINEDKIVVADIPKNEIRLYKKVVLINAMMDLENGICINSAFIIE
jgi:4-amino-4-deoxychorismate lyase